MVQIKHFTALPKMPYFQFPRRPENGPWRSKILSAYFFREIECAVSHKLLTEQGIHVVSARKSKTRAPIGGER